MEKSDEYTKKDIIFYMSKKVATQELKLFSGKQFDPVLVDKFIDMINKPSDDQVIAKPEMVVKV